MMNQERRNDILDILKRQGTITNDEIISRFNISIETVRRDLSYLEKQGEITRVYGGAVLKKHMISEPEYAKREQENSMEKNAIAINAEKFISSGETVFFDLGTTVQKIAQNLDVKKNINVFSNSLRTSITLSERGCNVFIPGGFLRKGEFSVSGNLTNENMALFNIDKAFIGVGGITEDGITDFIIEEGNLRSQIIKNAKTVIAVADYSKFGVRAMCNICSLKEIDILITDSKAPYEILEYLEKQKIRVVIA